ncbi:hypothetical protein Y1Q_0003523 [Alligator mississippiensis]|uniref:Uncharacterized protein n=1 Tax=Alligator mississippiensis TaxID=8496 RepID=A0A151M4D8_ALLMI|nr:hypothetical protein Y1Q_0003523 [Alligator mississippiensis]
MNHVTGQDFRFQDCKPHLPQGTLLGQGKGLLLAKISLLDGRDYDTKATKDLPFFPFESFVMSQRGKITNAII